jgi:hypothetical protein
MLFATPRPHLTHGLKYMNIAQGIKGPIGRKNTGEARHVPREQPNFAVLPSSVWILLDDIVAGNELPKPPPIM